MLVKTMCPDCAGSGIRIVQTSSLLGLRRRESAVTCDACHGSGQTTTLPDCTYCDGRGLIGNENELCRACNGTGRIDSFALIPRKLLRPDVEFQRRCDRCTSNTFRIVSNIETQKLNRSWEAEEALRQFEVIELVKVRCCDCGNNYIIQVAPHLHMEVDPGIAAEIEDMGINLGFLFTAGQAKQDSLRA